jgi:DNA-binding XRE family transcriptional regulator
MTTAPDQTLHRILSEARRAQGLTQSELARKIGCKQSAVSMMERGQAAALAWNKIEAIAKLLAVDIKAFAPDDASPTHAPATLNRKCYCPTFDCPANTPYAVNGRLMALPRELESEGKHCNYCGELLESTCPDCGSDINQGACCTTCGAAYIATPDALPNGIEAWAQAQRTRLNELGMASHRS